MVDWVALSVPFLYSGILFGSLWAFSYVYRQRQAQKAASLAPWFDPHTPRNIYLSLLHHEPSNDGGEKSAAKVPESILKAALMRRATEDIHRIIAVRNAKQALSTLLQRGCIGEELWQRYQRAEKEMEDELRDVVNEVSLSLNDLALLLNFVST
jgi:translocation protein SEC66